MSDVETTGTPPAAAPEPAPFKHGKVEDAYTVETRPFSQGLRALVYRAIKKETGEHVVVRQIYCPGEVEEDCAKLEVDLMKKVQREVRTHTTHTRERERDRSKHTHSSTHSSIAIHD